MHEFGMSNKEALGFISILTAIAAAISCVSYLVLGPLCKLFAEHKILIWAGFFLMTISRFVCIPFGNEPHLIDNYPLNDTTVGCPENFDWCHTTSKLSYAQFLLGFIFTAIAFPLGSSLIQTILSKKLGARPQGVWMGLFTGSGSLSRVVWPIVLPIVYTNLGVLWTFVITGCLMLITVIWLLVCQNKLKTDIEVFSNEHYQAEIDKTLEKKWKQTD